MSNRATLFFVQIREFVLLGCSAGLLFGSLDALSGFSLGGWNLNAETYLTAQAWGFGCAFFLVLALMSGVCGSLFMGRRGRRGKPQEVLAMIVWMSLGLSSVLRLALYLTGNQRHVFYQDIASVAGAALVAGSIQGLIWKRFLSSSSKETESPRSVDRMLTSAVFPCVALTLAAWWSASHSYKPGADFASLLVLLFATGIYWAANALYRSKYRFSLLTATSVTLGIIVVFPFVFAPKPYINLENSERPPYQGSVPRVLVITIDTLRADALGSYNGGTHPTPNLDELAERGSRFANAVSCAPWTLPSMISLVTGLPVSVHVERSYDAKLPGGRATLAERFRDAGYATGAIGDNAFLRPGRGFENGYDHYNIFPRERGGNADNLPESLGARLLAYVLSLKVVTDTTTTTLVDLSLEWLREHRDEPFFFWIHIFDPHAPYAPPPGFRPAGKPPGRFGYKMGLNDQINRDLLVLDEEEKKWLKELYLAEVRYVDAEIGRLIEEVRSFGKPEETLILLTSDHGEEFFEHGKVDHGHSLYQELIHVPLIVSLPGRVPAAVRDDWVSGEAVYGTLLELAGLSFESHMPGQQGLFDSGRRDENGTRPVFSAATMRQFVSQETAIIDGWKLIRAPIRDFTHLFNLEGDPREADDLLDRNPREVDRLKSVLKNWRDAGDDVRDKLELVTGDTIEMPESTIDVLQDLGYLQ